MTPAVHYLVAWVAVRTPRERGTPWYWSAPHPGTAEGLAAARQQARRLVDTGEASLSFVVVDRDGHREINGFDIWPHSARAVVKHTRELLDLCRQPRGVTCHGAGVAGVSTAGPA